MTYHLVHDSKEYEVNLTRVEGEKYSAEVQGETVEFEYLSVSPDNMVLIINNVYHSVFYNQTNDTLSVFLEGEIFELEWLEGKKSAVRALSREHKGQIEKKITAPMPGKILKILVKENQTVKINQALFILESMKMENEVQCPMIGKIAKINYKENDLVSVGDPIIEIE
jgi:biotin carboxyl carrier protein